MYNKKSYQLVEINPQILYTIVRTGGLGQMVEENNNNNSHEKKYLRELTGTALANLRRL